MADHAPKQNTVFFEIQQTLTQVDRYLSRFKLFPDPDAFAPIRVPQEGWLAYGLKATGMSQSELADRVGKRKQAVSKFLRANADPVSPAFREYAEALGLEVRVIVNLSPAKSAGIAAIKSLAPQLVALQKGSGWEDCYPEFTQEADAAEECGFSASARLRQFVAQVEAEGSIPPSTGSLYACLSAQPEEIERAQLHLLTMRKSHSPEKALPISTIAELKLAVVSLRYEAQEGIDMLNEMQAAARRRPIKRAVQISSSR